jgi:drug/metabolite transporter (DMT)-like permease
LGGLGFALFAYSGFFLAPAAHGAVLLHGTLPLFTFLIVLALMPGATSRRGLAGIVMIALGIALMASDSLSGVDTWQLIGDASLLAASICWSAYGIMAQRLKIPPLQAAAMVAVLSALAFWPVYLPTTGAAGLFTASWDQLLLQAVYQGILIGFVSILVYTRAIATLGATGTTLFTAAVPCLTTIAAVPLLGETPTTAVWMGVAIVSVGMIVAVFGRWRSM